MSVEHLLIINYAPGSEISLFENNNPPTYKIRILIKNYDKEIVGDISHMSNKCIYHGEKLRQNILEN